MKDCIFCKIIAGELPCYKIYEDYKVLAFLDISMDSFGHTLVIPKMHCLNITDCKSEYLSQVFKVTKEITKHYIEKCGFAGANIVSNVGNQQSVEHFHIHIFPRRSEEKMLQLFEAGIIKTSLAEQQQMLKLL